MKEGIFVVKDRSGSRVCSDVWPGRQVVGASHYIFYIIYEGAAQQGAHEHQTIVV